MKTSILSLVTVALIQSATATTFFGVTAENQLVSFDSATPGTYASSVGITGLVGGDGTTPDPFASIVNLSYHPEEGRFYGIDTNANFYIVNSNGTTNLVSNQFTPAGYSAGLAYDPFTSQFLFVSEEAEHFNLSTAGAITAHPTFTYGQGDPSALLNPAIFGLAIDGPYGTYMIDYETDSLVQWIDPSLPELYTIGSLGVDVTGFGGLVVDEDGNLYASLSTDALTSGFYSIDTMTGEATLVGALPSGVSSLAAVPEPSVALLGLLSCVPLFRRRRA